MIHRPLILLISALAASAALFCQDPAARPTTRPGGEYLDAVAAKVNRTVITKSQVDRKLGPRVMAGPAADYEHAFHNMLLTLVFGAIEQDAVEKVGLSVPKRYIVEQLEQQKERKGAAEVSEGIKEQGYKSEEEYLDALGKETSRNTYLAAQAGQFASKAPQFRPDFWTEPTASEIRRFYRQHQADEFTQKNQAHLFAISLPYLSFNNPGAKEGDLSSGMAHVREIAATIKEELARGTDFATLARRYGRELKAEEGGDLGWIATDASFQKEVVDFAFNGPLKQLSDPIPYPTREATRGIILVLVSERANERVVPFAEAQQKIRDFLRNGRVELARRKIVQKLLDDSYISPPDVKRDLLRSQQQ